MCVQSQLQEQPFCPGCCSEMSDRDGPLDLGQLRSRLPVELQFLCDPDCCPDLNDPAVQKRGNMRGKDLDKAMQIENKKASSRWRQRLRKVVYSTFVQGFVIGVIFLDILVTILSFTNVFQTEAQKDQNDRHPLQVAVDWLCVVVLTLDVVLRWFVEGCRFLLSKMNIFELLLVIANVVEFALAVYGAEKSGIPLPALRTMRPIFRLLRIVRSIARTAGKGQTYLMQLRRQVSGDRVRFQQDGFDLDLAHITGQIIAMSTPATGAESVLRNPVLDVARFLNERKGNQYLVVNLMEDLLYPTSPFFDRYMHFPIPQDGVPTLMSLVKLCTVLDAFLKADPGHIVAVHSKNGQGRVGLVIVSLLLHRGVYQTVVSAIEYFEHHRVHPEAKVGGSTQTLDCASQRRFLDFFENVCAGRDKRHTEVRAARLKKIHIAGLPQVTALEVKCWTHEVNKLNSKRGTIENFTMVTPEATSPDNDLEPGVAEKKSEDSTENEVQKVLELPTASMMSRVRRILAEGAFDSLAAGSRPVDGGEPVFSSAEDNKNISLKTQPQLDGEVGPAPGEWEVRETDLSGEIRLEFFRPVSAKKSEKDKAFRGGMIFSCWLHTSYLELDEAHDERRGIPKRFLPQNKVVVVLDRFGLDKAADAPTLRSYSQSLKIRLEFEVEQRWDTIATANMQSFEVYSRLSMSDPFDLGWLTWVSQIVWPSFQSAFKTLLMDSVMPSVKSSLPGPLKGVELERFELGSSYPSFGPLTACSRNQTHGEEFEVQLDIGIDYSTDVDVVLTAGMASFAISHLKLKGILSLKFKPILGELPVFSALQLFFLNLPELDLRFSKNLEIANASMFRNLIFGAINDALYNFMVLPNIININWADPKNDDTVSFLNVLPVGVLRLYVVAARGLSLEGSMFKRLPDSYAQMSLGSQTAKTATISKNSDPIWDEAIDFLVYDERQHITASVADVDFTGSVRVLGKLGAISIADVLQTGPSGTWHDLEVEAPVSGEASRSPPALLVRAVMFDLSIDMRIIESLVESGESAVIDLVESSVTLRPLSAEISSSPSIADLSMVQEATDVQGVDDPFSNLSACGCDSVALLVCEVFGGRLPPALGPPSSADLRMSIGGSRGIRRATEVSADPVPGAIGEKNLTIIEKLSTNLKLNSEQIAAALGEEVIEVERAVRKRGQNLHCPQKITVLLRPQDLHNATEISFNVLQKDKAVAVGSVPLPRVMSTSMHNEVMSFKALTAESSEPCDAADLDIELRLFALVQQETPEEDIMDTTL